jgi:hypothetical protein
VAFADGRTLKADVYLDARAPAIEDWHAKWEAELKVARADFGGASDEHFTPVRTATTMSSCHSAAPWRWQDDLGSRGSSQSVLASMDASVG